MSLSLQSVQVTTGSDDSESYLVFSDEFLVAVLVRLSGQHEEEAGLWFLEAGFGPISGPEQLPFATLDEAQSWIVGRLAKMAIRKCGKA